MVTRPRGNSEFTSTKLIYVKPG